MLRNLGKTSSQKRFHDHRLDTSLVEFFLQIFSLCISSRCMGPVDVIELNLHEIPVVLVVICHQLVKAFRSSVERESEVADASCLSLLEEILHHAVVDESLSESVAVTDRVEKIVVDIICLEVFLRLLIHFDRVLLCIVAEVGELGSHEIAFTWISAEGYTSSLFALALKIYRRRVVIVHSMLHRIVHKPVHGFLIDDVSSVLILDHRPAHAAVSEDADLVSVAVVGPVCHSFRLCTGS